MTLNVQFGDALEEGMLAGVFDGTAQRQALVGKSGSDVKNYLYGEAVQLTGFETGGNDVLIGGANANSNLLFGDVRLMSGDSQGGDDVLIGGAGAA